ncbi:MAG: AgmX/PglI C-terminal domain-containing protein [Bdellovibrionales bacterium]|nr:AgmX/PglI C-terminal domain-containing protein [Bdellovibrionales bacterium]
MKILIIEQTNTDGHRKSWRVTPQESPSAFGSSRLAQIISQDQTSTPFEGVFEFKDDRWMFYDLHRDRLENSLTCELKELTSLKLEGSVLKITCFEKKDSLSEILDRSGQDDSPQNTDSTKKAYQFFIVRHGSKILETQVLPMNGVFFSEKVANAPPFKVMQSTEWKRMTVGFFEISQKTVYLKDPKELATPSDLMDSESRRSTGILLVAAALIGLMAWLAPKGQTDYAPPEITKTAQRVIIRNEIKNRKLEKEKAAKEIARAVASTPPPETPPSEPKTKTAGVKVAHLLKNLQGGRISSLLGKVSAQAARSKNLIISSGVPAGLSPSGPALSAVGPVDQSSGRDWKTDAKGAGLTVNTLGKGGGKNIQGLGRLQGGKVGTGGVGLIEEESEIVGGLDRDIIAQYIKTQLGQILLCYERQLSAQPDLFGKVAIRFEIGSTGQVTSQKIGDTTLKNATVEGCILNKVAVWKFPAPQGGTKVNVTYPFLFKSTN